MIVQVYCKNSKFSLRLMEMSSNSPRYNSKKSFQRSSLASCRHRPEDNCGQARIKYFPCLYFKGIEAQLGCVVCVEA